jgi:hypothetical protein
VTGLMLLLGRSVNGPQNHRQGGEKKPDPGYPIS